MQYGGFITILVDSRIRYTIPFKTSHLGLTLEFLSYKILDNFMHSITSFVFRKKYSLFRETVLEQAKRNETCQRLLVEPKKSAFPFN